MKNLLLHVYTEKQMQNFNTIMNKWEIQCKSTVDNMMMCLLSDFEQTRGQCFSFSAFTDHINSLLQSQGRVPTTSMWNTVSSGSDAKATFSKILNQDMHIDSMLKLMHVPEEVLKSV